MVKFGIGLDADGWIYGRQEGHLGLNLELDAVESYLDLELDAVESYCGTWTRLGGR